VYVLITGGIPAAADWKSWWWAIGYRRRRRRRRRRHKHPS